MQLLWINLVTDSLPAIALGMEAVEDDVMDKKPKPKNEGIFAHGLGVKVVIQGIMFASLTLIAFFIGVGLPIGDVIGGALLLPENEGILAQGRTMAFAVLALCQIVQAYNMRSEHSLFKIGAFKNKTLNLAALASTLLVAIVLFTPVGIAFSVVMLPWHYYLIALGLILVPFVVMEISKAVGIIRHRH
jgi:Ca2+-transporting ATPase